MAEKSVIGTGQGKIHVFKKGELSFRGAPRERFMEKGIVTSWKQQRTCVSSREDFTGAKEKWEKAKELRRQVG